MAQIRKRQNGPRAIKTRNPNAGKVLLLSMPMGSMDRPSLGLSYLKAQLQRMGTICDVRYPSFTFADMVGADEYRWVSSEIPYIAFAGDWCFTECLYGSNPSSDAEYIREVLQGLWRFENQSVSRLLRIRQTAQQLIDHCLTSIPWQDYSIVGFTSTFEQNVSSLALARQIKAHYPDKVIVFGGANWEGEMGEELHRQFAFVDYVCSGEADASFPALVAQIQAGQLSPDKLPSGVVYRDAEQTRTTGRPEPIREMDGLPIPDFTDYFQQWNLSSASVSSLPTVLVETSRGCWWGDKSHCTFCGLNGASMSFRSKSGARALSEIKYLADTWQTEHLEVVDNILDMKYFSDLIPALAQENRDWQIFYEVKANLTRKHVAALHAAGVTRIQPGIESLSDHVLTLMGKGTTGLRNIQLLKWCKEYGIRVEWNLLYGFPGETKADYDGMLNVVDSIAFLQPPGACGQIRMDRFSPYFEKAAAYGLTNVRPMKPYAFLYRVSPQSLMKIAYHFDFDYQDGRQPRQYAQPLIQAMDNWRLNGPQGNLQASHQADGSLLVIDSRRQATRSFRLRPVEAAVYDYCDEVHTVAAIHRMLGDKYPDLVISQCELEDFLNRLSSEKLMLNCGANWLSLAVTVPKLQLARQPVNPASATTISLVTNASAREQPDMAQAL